MSTGRIIVYNLFVVVYLNLILIFLRVPKKQAADSDAPINKKIYAEKNQYTKVRSEVHSNDLVSARRTRTKSQSDRLQTMCKQWKRLENVYTKLSSHYWFHYRMSRHNSGENFAIGILII